MDRSPAAPGKVGVFAFVHGARTVPKDLISGFCCKIPCGSICFQYRDIVVYDQNRNAEKRDIFFQIYAIPCYEPGIAGFAYPMGDRGIRSLTGPDHTITE